MSTHRRIEAFLGGSAAVLGIVGQVGSGKLYAVELAAKATGFQTTILDRSQGTIHYSRLGTSMLGGEGLSKAITIVCGADSELLCPVRTACREARS